MVHDYNPSYSGGRDQEDHGSKPVWKKKNHKNRAGEVARYVGPEFKPQNCKKKKELPYSLIHRIVNDEDVSCEMIHEHLTLLTSSLA
jgi:hypothetical protein